MKGQSDGCLRIREKAQQKLKEMKDAGRGLDKNIEDMFIRLLDLSRFTFAFSNCTRLLQAAQARPTRHAGHRQT